MPIRFLACLCFLLAANNLHAEQPTITHSFFVSGPDFTGIIGEDGKPTFDTGRPGARDGFVLANGNLLIAWSDVVREMTREKKVVFEYKKPAESSELGASKIAASKIGASEIGTVERLENGRTLITELGKKPRLLEVDADGKIAVSIALKPETDNAHMQTRMARKLPSGNYLVPHLLAFAVKEYSPDGTVVREIKTDLAELGGRKAENWPFTAIRLANGNTLVTLTHGNKVVEFDEHGAVVWKVENGDIAEHPFADPRGAQRLPNGNTVIASYGSKGPIKIFEVTLDKKMVWKFTGKQHAHEIQILTTNGEPIAGRPMK